MPAGIRIPANRNVAPAPPPGSPTYFSPLGKHTPGISADQQRTEEDSRLRADQFAQQERARADADRRDAVDFQRSRQIADESAAREQANRPKLRSATSIKKDIDILMPSLPPPPGYAPAGTPTRAQGPPLLPEGGGASSLADDSAFARSKDRIGLTRSAALRALQGSMDARGISGGGAEAAGVGAVMAGTAGDLGDVSRDMAMESERRAQEVEDRNYEGDFTRRRQDIDVWDARNNMLLNLMKQRGGSIY